MFKLIFLMFFYFLVPEIIGAIPESIIALKYPSFTPGFLIAIISLLFFFRFQKKRNVNVLNFDKDTMIRGFVFLWPNVLAILVLVIEYIAGLRICGKPTYSAFAISIMAGIAEEVAFRAVPLVHAAKTNLTKKNLVTAVVVSTMIFGFIHMTNMLAGMTFRTGVYQVTLAVFIGLLYAAVFLRTGSIVPAIIMHFTNDFVALFDTNSVIDGIMTMQKLSYLDWIDAAICVIGFFFAIYLLRPQKWPAILELWNNKLNRTEINEESA